MTEEGLSPDLVASYFEYVVQIQGRIKDDLIGLATSRRPLSAPARRKLRQLVDDADDASAKRLLLGAMDPDELMAGVAVWAARHGAAVPPQPADIGEDKQ